MGPRFARSRDEKMLPSGRRGCLLEGRRHFFGPNDLWQKKIIHIVRIVIFFRNKWPEFYSTKYKNLTTCTEILKERSIDIFLRSEQSDVHKSLCVLIISWSFSKIMYHKDLQWSIIYIVNFCNFHIQNLCRSLWNLINSVKSPVDFWDIKRSK